MQEFVLVNLTDTDIPWKIPGDHTKLKISLAGCYWAVDSDQERGEMGAGVHRNACIWNSNCSLSEVLILCEVPSPCEVLSLTPTAAAQGSCQCCTHRTWLCFVTCKSALVLVAGRRLFKNQFLPRKKQLQILIITGIAEVWCPKLLGTGLSLFQWGQCQLVCVQVCRAVHADVYSAVSTNLQETTCACWTVDAMFGNVVQKLLRTLPHQELQH